jgi:hypothetical protein
LAAFLEPLKKEDIDISKFIDLDKKNEVFYDNIYLKNEKLVIKIPLPSPDSQISEKKIKIEPFDLPKYTYLLDY